MYVVANTIPLHEHIARQVRQLVERDALMGDLPITAVHMVEGESLAIVGGGR